MTTLSYQAPTQVIAGDSIEFLVPLPSDYATWTGSARLVGPSSMNATTCTTEGSDLHLYFRGQGAEPSTAGLTAGQYSLVVFVTDDDDRKTLAQYPITIREDLETGAPALAHAIEMLGVVEAAIKARLTGNDDGGIESYSLNGRTVEKIPMPELQRLRAKYAAEVSQLQNPNKGFGSVKVTFSSAGQMSDLRSRFIP